MALAAMQASAEQKLGIVLQPISHPELGDIAIDDDLFAIGRGEAPFVSYPAEVVDALSRRHARIFTERGGAYIADLDSKNGTAVNGVAVHDKPSRLRDGDEVRFGTGLSYRVRLIAREARTESGEKLVGLTLTPDRDDLGIDPIEVKHFPFLVSKTDDNFARYRAAYPHQVEYLSRRHAHIFLKAGRPYIEDLGSTNGTFVGGQRLDERAVLLGDGELLAFGGHHFVYRVHYVTAPAFDPTVTQYTPTAPGHRPEAAAPDKTTFLAAPDSFLDIFCVDRGPPADAPAETPSAAPEDADRPGKGKRRGRLAVFLSELTDAFGGQERRSRRLPIAIAAVLGLVALLAVGLQLRGASEREVKEALAAGRFDHAAAAAEQHLKRNPDNAEMRMLGTEAVLKAGVPPWLARLRSRDYRQAAAAVAAMRAQAEHNPDAQALVTELEWMGNLQAFVVGRGGGEAPIRVFADEERIQALLKPWNEDPVTHQRAFDRIVAYVPEFADAYAEALSHLRKLRSDDAVYLAAIERLKATVAAELKRDRPDLLEAALKEYGDKYPRLALEPLRQDLRRYLDLTRALAAPRLGRLVLAVGRAGFVTPPFQAKVQTLVSAGSLPGPELVRRYEPVGKAWAAGDLQQTLASLQPLAAGAWSEAVQRDITRKKAIAQRFAELRQGREAKDYEDRLLDFYADLDGDEDAYFVRAAETSLGLDPGKALKRAQERLDQAQALWKQYRENGAIGADLRAEAEVSAAFRQQARLLTDADALAQQARRLHALTRAEPAGAAARLADDIAGEIQAQRQALLEKRESLDPALLNAKLGLLQGAGNGQGKSS